MNRTILSVLFALTAASLLPARIQAQAELRRNAGKSVEYKLPHQEKKYTIATHPLYNFNSGLRFDFEKRIRDTPSWIQAGLAGYLVARRDREDNQWVMITNDELSHLWGTGLELNFKHFVNRKESLYFAGGCSYSHYSIEYYDRYWSSYTEHGLEYRLREYGIVKQGIDKLGINAYFGYQIPSPGFLFDMFVGLGYRHSLRNNSEAKRFDEQMLAFGYTGIVVITGVRFGVKF
ncbi:MAG: hypothetical protein LBK97_04455 [Prevotellaceae bacterium]|jgi:hypothetical protein|nr:hypothetical protein [Prevotellaceae bacterium]